MTFTLRCKSVNRCACCRRIKVKQDRARAFMGAAEQGKIAMVTLTIDPSDPRWWNRSNRAGKKRPLPVEMLADPRSLVIRESWLYQSWAWNRLRANLSNRRALRGFAYFRGVELTGRGFAHVHAVVRVPDVAAYMALRVALRGDEAVRGTLPHKNRKNGLAIMAGFGKVVDVQLARSKGDVARYVSKMEDAGAPLAPATLAAIARDTDTPGGGRNVAAYATKGVGAILPRYSRRSAHSRGSARMSAWAPGWIKPTPIAGYVWRLAAASEETVRGALSRSGFTIDDPASFRVSSAASPQEVPPW